MALFFWTNIILLLANYDSVSRIPVYNAVPVSGSKGMVTSDAPICSTISAEILKKGGNAVDASVTATLCQGLVYPFASGIGGGGFMVIYKKGQDPEFINFREIAPKLANETMFKENPKLSTTGGLSVGIPGEVKGLELAHSKYGKLKWSEIVEPVVKLAIDGFEVPPLLSSRIKEYLSDVKASKGLSQVYLPNNEPLQNGTIFKNPALGGTLKAIMEQGSKAFYEGPIAERIAKVIQENGGIIDQDELKSYEPYSQLPTSATFRGNKIYSIPPPGSGAVLIAALNIFENFPTNLPMDYLKAHRIIETMKHAYAFRLELGDPKFVPSVKNVVQKALSKEEALRRFKMINDTATYEPSYYTQTEGKIDDHGTSHVNVLDENGLGVTITSTINTFWGSKVLDTETGILFNNEMDDFSTPGAPNFFNLPPSESNYICPGKIPQSSMAPTLMTDAEGNIQYLAGASGGSVITTTVFQILLNLIDGGYSAAEAISEPRIHHQLIPNEIKYEPGWNDKILEGLKDRNHTLTYSNFLGYGGVIVKQKDRIWGAADNRKLSIASGY